VCENTRQRVAVLVSQWEITIVARGGTIVPSYVSCSTRSSAKSVDMLSRKQSKRGRGGVDGGSSASAMCTHVLVDKLKGDDCKQAQAGATIADTPPALTLHTRTTPAHTQPRPRSHYSLPHHPQPHPTQARTSPDLASITPNR
jgi:hypothetical protein